MKPRPLRALFLNDTARNGGPGRTLYCVLKYLDPAEVFRSVVVPRPGVVSELLEQGRVVEELRFDPLLVENPIAPWRREMVRADYDAALPLRAIRTVGNVARGTSCVLELAKRVRREQFDVLFCNGTTANFFGGLVAALTGVPTIWHVFYTEVAPALAPIHARLSAREEVRAIICVSKPTAVQFANVENKVRLIHDAIDAGEYTPGGAAGVLRGELGLGSDVVVFGSQGRILRRKGYVEMVHAAEATLRLLTAEEQTRCRFVVLGDTPADMKEDHLAECRALVRERRLESFVHFLGYRPDVRPYVVDFDVAVVPSVYPDPLPRSVMEAMAIAKPVLAFDVGGIGEMVEDGVSGALVRGAPPDVEGMAQACVAYVRDPERRKRQGAAARATIERDYDARAHSRLILEELAKATAWRRGSSTAGAERR
ncbi:MAG TPA: glycosyltransferase [Polyangiaceae bacterium]|jgi:glycosyltransferase involved in cell wall biosynthesis